MHQPVIPVQKLNDAAIIPAYQSDLAAGLDLAACLAEPITLDPGRIGVIPTGIALAIAPGFEGQVRPRSGLATKFGLTVANAPGTIDADYRGELKVALINLGREPFTIEHGMRIAQLVISPVARATLTLTDALPPTTRGQGGFGSTGAR